MSIASEIQRIKNDIASAYANISSKGGSLPSKQDSSNLISAINSISSVPNALVVPFNMNGLCFWLDGDSNTRNGVDRSKKYFENLMWLPNRLSSTKNVETIQNNGSSNVWNGNILNIYNYAYYPYLVNSNESFSVESVLKVNSTMVGSSIDAYVISNGYAGGFFLCVNTANQYYFAICNAKSGSGYEYLHPTNITMTLNKVYYFCCTYNASDKKVREYVMHLTPNGVHSTVTLTNLNVASTQSLFTAFGSQCYTSSTSENPNGGTRSGKYGVGMIRYWRRALSLAEIKEGYKDAKRRFDCE